MMTQLFVLTLCTALTCAPYAQAAAGSWNQIIKAPESIRASFPHFPPLYSRHNHDALQLLSLDEEITQEKAQACFDHYAYELRLRDRTPSELDTMLIKAADVCPNHIWPIRRTEIIALIIAGARPHNPGDHHSFNKEQSFWRAVIHNDYTMAQFLLSFGADPNGTNCVEDPLLFSCKTVPMLQLLLHHSADIHAKNDDGKTILHHIMRSDEKDKVELAEFLLQQKISVDPLDDDEHTPLMILTKAEFYYKHAETPPARLLIDHGASRHYRRTDEWDKIHQTAGEMAHHAARYSHILTKKEKERSKVLANFIDRYAPTLYETIMRSLILTLRDGSPEAIDQAQKYINLFLSYGTKSVFNKPLFDQCYDELMPQKN